MEGLAPCSHRAWVINLPFQWCPRFAQGVWKTDHMNLQTHLLFVWKPTPLFSIRCYTPNRKGGGLILCWNAPCKILLQGCDWTCLVSPKVLKAYFSTNRMSKMQFPERFITGILRSGSSSCYSKSWGSREQNTCHRTLEMKRKITRAGWFCVSKGFFCGEKEFEMLEPVAERRLSQKAVFEDATTA